MYFAGFTVRQELEACRPAGIVEQPWCHELIAGIDIESRVSEISVGQQQRVAVYSALCRDTPVVILDEPFAYMDRGGAKAAADLVLDRVVKGGLVIVLGNPGGEGQQLRESADVRLEIRDGVVDHWKSYVGLSPELPRFSSVSRDAPIALQVSGLRYGYSRHQGPIVDNCSFEVRQGECVGIGGANGCGKSTLLRVVAGLLKAKRAPVWLGGRLADVRRLRSETRYAFQNAEAQVFETSVEAELRFGFSRAGMEIAAVDRALQHAASLLPFSLDSDPFGLSVGQRKLLSIVETLLTANRVALLDEPGTSLDSEAITVVHRLVAGLLAKGGSVVLCYHTGDSVCGEWCHRRYVMEGGKLRKLEVEA